MKTYFAWALISCALACGGQTTGDIDAGDAATSDGGNDGTTIVPKDAGVGGTCSASEPCPNAMLCGYDESQGCAATTGECFSAGAICNTFQPGCACDGTIINVACTGLPNGYATAPLAYVGQCDGGK
jgi:hypothetical protein